MSFAIRIVGILIALMIVGLLGYFSAQMQSKRTDSATLLLSDNVRGCVSETKTNIKFFENELKSYIESCQKPIPYEFASVEDLLRDINNRWYIEVQSDFAKRVDECLIRANALAEARDAAGRPSIAQQWFPDKNSWANFVQNIIVGLIFVFVGIGIESLLIQRK